MRIKILLFLALTTILILACSSTEGGGSGGLEPSDTAPFIIDGFTCANVFDDKPVGIGDEFWLDDRVYIWLAWQNMGGTHTVKIIWVAPNDKLFETSNTFKSTSGQLTTYFWLDTTASAPAGQWLAEVYIDNSFVRSYAFWLNHTN